MEFYHGRALVTMAAPLGRTGRFLGLGEARVVHAPESLSGGRFPKSPTKHRMAKGDRHREHRWAGRCLWEPVAPGKMGPGGVPRPKCGEGGAA